MSAVCEPINESLLDGEAGTVYLFRWLNELEKRVKQLRAEEVKHNQKELIDTLVKIVTAPEPYPPPGRPIRHLASRCLIAIFEKGESRPLYDILQILIKSLGDPKLSEKDVQRTACLYCIGELMQGFGSNVMSLMGEIVSQTSRMIKVSTASLVRFHAFVALRHSLTTATRAVADAQIRDILKQAKAALNDKALVVQRSACEVLIVLYALEDPSRTVTDIEQIVALCTKALETADQLTRGAHARLVGHLLASSQCERLVPIVTPVKKPRKDVPEGEQEGEDPTTEPVTQVAKPLMRPEEMFAILSTHYHRLSVSRKTRVGVFTFYQALLTSLGPSFVEANYPLIFSHFMNDILASPKAVSASLFETALTQKLVRIVCRDLMGLRMLGEQAQIDAILELTNTYIRRWPALLPGSSAPLPLILSSALDEVAGLLQQLGNAPANVQDALMDPLIGLLVHPQETVRTRAAWSLRCFCYIAPARLPKVLLHILELIQRDVDVIVTPTAPQDITLRSLGHAYGLAAVVAVIRERPLYVSYDTSAKILDLTIQLLKRAGTHDTRIAAVEVEIAWTLLASLMTLGPNFVRSQLPQLLVLWRNALPKPTSKDSDAGSGRTASEWVFLLHVRETALGAIYSFLSHNSPTLVTLDVARRLASLLTNVLSFANSFGSQKIDVQTGPGDVDASTLIGREAALRRRIYQCFSLLGFAGVADSTQSALLQSAVAQLASPTGYIGSAMQAAIASSAGDLTSLSQCTDGYAYGVTSFQLEGTSNTSAHDEGNRDQRERLNRDAVENALDEVSQISVVMSVENDSLLVCTSRSSMADTRAIESPPSATGVVDAAIRLYGSLMPNQTITGCATVLQHQLEFVRSPKLERNNGRRLAVKFNSVVTLLLALREVTASGRRSAKETFGHQSIVLLLSPFLLDTLADSEATVRSMVSEVIGRLASCVSSSSLSALVKDLVDRVVSNRDPHARAGYALSFGLVFSHIGGLAGGALLKTTINVLMSLSQDSHPVVHYWALSAMSRVINAASLAFAPFVVSTLSMVFKIYVSDVHELEGGSIHNSNIRGDLPSYQILCQIMDAVVNVLGPDLQESSNTQGLVLDLVHELFLESDEGVRVEAIRTMQHLLMFAADQVTIPELVRTFQTFLTSHRRLLKIASINALYQLVQRDALMMSKIGGDALVAELFAMLDSDPTIIGVRGVITSWLRQTAVLNPSAWIDVCQRIMSRSVAHQSRSRDTKGELAQDDEAEGLNVGAGKADMATGPQTMARWRTQLFSLECLHLICALVSQGGRREHVDIRFARANGAQFSTLLVSRVSDLIKIAFTASASHVMEIRQEGLILLKDVIETFASSPDPDFEDALMLEQHQAPITAALTPAFAADSAPEILACAIETCAIFVGSGVIKVVDKMGRILRLLTSVLEQTQDAGTLSLGEAGELSPNASVMLRIAALTAWAKLEVARPQQPYLQNVIQPHVQVLVSLWVAALRDYATIRAEIEVGSQDTSMAPLDSSNSGLGRDVLLPYYIDAWPVILHAVSICMESDGGIVLRTMDGLDMTAPEPSSDRKEPAVLFFVLFGLAFEALVGSSSEDLPSIDRARMNTKIALKVLKYLVRPAYSGIGFVEGPIFEEFISVSYRIAMTDPADVRNLLVEVLASIVESREGVLPPDDNLNEPFSATLPQTQCLRVIAFIVRETVSRHRNSRSDTSDASERAALIKVAFKALAVMQRAFNESSREDLRAVAIALYSELLQDESVNVDIVEPTLPSLKAILAAPHSMPGYHQLLHGFLSGCTLSIDELGGREGVLSTKKIKNNMLCAVLVLTMFRDNLRLSQTAVEHFCRILTSKLVENTEVSLTAAQCIRTIITAALSGNHSLRACIPSLLSSIVGCMAQLASTVPEDVSPLQLAMVTEVSKTFDVLIAGSPEAHHAVLMGALLPALSLLLDQEHESPHSMRAVAMSQVLGFAANNAGPFRQAISKLDVSTQGTLEVSIRSALGKQGPSNVQTSARPQISLRAF